MATPQDFILTGFFHGCDFYSVFTVFSLLLFLHPKWGLGAPICDINYNITINQHMGPYPMSGPECKCRWGSSKVALNLHLIAWPPYYIPLSCGITLYNTSIYYYYNTVILQIVLLCIGVCILGVYGLIKLLHFFDSTMNGQTHF